METLYQAQRFVASPADFFTSSETVVAVFFDVTAEAGKEESVAAAHELDVNHFTGLQGLSRDSVSQVRVKLSN